MLRIGYLITITLIVGDLSYNESNLYDVSVEGVVG